MIKFIITIKRIERKNEDEKEEVYVDLNVDIDTSTPNEEEIAKEIYDSITTATNKCVKEKSIDGEIKEITNLDFIKNFVRSNDGNN